MCGRYAIVPTRAAWAKLDEILGESLLEQLRALKPRYNVAPTQTVPIIVEDHETQEPTILEATWGFVPSWWKQPKPPMHNINARVETAATSGLWRGSFKSQRCLVPATHYYEWLGIKTPKQAYALTVNDGEGYMFAGIWSWAPAVGDEPPRATVAILTTGADESIAEIHNRMPIILSPICWRRWISAEMTDLGQISDLLIVNTVSDVRFYKVGKKVGNVRNDELDLIEAPNHEGDATTQPYSEP